MSNPVQPEQTQFEVHTPEFPAPQQQGTAYLPPAAPVTPQPKKTGVVVLAILAVLLLGGAGAFGALYLSEKSNSADLSKQIEGKDREISTLTKQVKDSKDEATKASDAQKKAEADAASAQKCRAAAKLLMEAALAQDEAKGEASMKDLFTTC
jgi:uncharacterized protein HemX